MATVGAAPGEVHIHSQRDPSAPPLRVLHGPAFKLYAFTLFDAEGGRITQAGPNNTLYLWPLDTFPDALPALLGRPTPSTWYVGAFDPDGRWLVTASVGEPTIEFWSISGPLRREIPSAGRAAFTGDGRWLATCPMTEPARLWPMHAADGSARVLLAEPCSTLATSPEGGDVFVGTMDGRAFLCPSQGGPPRLLPGRWNGIQVITASFDAQGRRVIASPGGYAGTLADPTQRVLRVWDLPSGRPHEYSVAHLVGADWMGLGADFAPDGSLYVGGVEGVRRLSLPAGPDRTVTSQTVYASGADHHLSRDGRRLLAVSGFRQLGGAASDLLLFDLAEKTSRRITTHGARLRSARLSPSGRVVVTVDQDGAVRAGPVSGEEPHLLPGHKGTVGALAISPDERWIALGGDQSISIWPMPDVTKPPLHKLPHAELLAKLDALTNLRVVRDTASATGWKLDVGPFPGWKDVPTW